MKTIYKKKWLPCSIEKAWHFFSRPENLAKITPEYMNFEIQNETLAEEIFNGMIIEYKVRPVLGIPLRWVSEIKHVKEFESFIDDQRIGPYKLWHHLHKFTPGNDGVFVEDIVHFQLPGGILGDFLYKIQVKGQLNQIFEYRDKVISEIFIDQKERNYVSH